jgi:RNA polymerase sigma-70 factor (ECF subfamily)
MSLTQNTFPPTLWSLVRLAVAEGRPGADGALNELCRVYERPILTFIRRHCATQEAAEDLKQSFFEHLLSRNALAGAEQARVKLRAYLITKLQTFLIDQHRHATAQKRGAGNVVNLADLSEEQQHLAEPVDHVTPYVEYQRQWMQTLASRALEQLRAEYDARGSSELFSAISPFITRSSDDSLAVLSARLGRPEGTLKSDISRLRSKCQQLIREQVAATLDDPTPDNITAELKELMGYRVGG